MYSSYYINTKEKNDTAKPNIYFTDRLCICVCIDAPLIFVYYSQINNMCMEVQNFKNLCEIGLSLTAVINCWQPIMILYLCISKIVVIKMTLQFLWLYTQIPFYYQFGEIEYCNGIECN